MIRLIGHEVHETPLVAFLGVSGRGALAIMVR